MNCYAEAKTVLHATLLCSSNR